MTRTLKRYAVTELVLYEVMARSAAEAEEIIQDSEDRDKFCIGVLSREVGEMQEETTP